MAFRQLCFCLIFFLFLSGTLFSEDILSDFSNTNGLPNPPEDNFRIFSTNTNALNPQASYHIAFEFDILDMNDTYYNFYHFTPDFFFDRFYIQLDIALGFDGDGALAKYEWDNWQALLAKIRTIRYGNTNDNVRLKWGIVENYTIANGLIMDLFYGTVNYPSFKRPGLQLDVEYTNFGISAMANNIFSFDILSARAYYRPLAFAQLPPIDNLEIGVTAAADLNPNIYYTNYRMPYLIATNTNETVQPFVIYGVDLGCPLINSSWFYFKPYLDFAGISGKGTGEAVGFSSKAFTIIPLRAELRINQPRFIPSYFDIYYEADRIHKYDSLENISNSSLGWMAETGLTFFNDKIHWSVQLNNTMGSSKGMDLVMRFSIDREMLNLISGDFIWASQDLQQINDLIYFKNGSSLFMVNAYYHIADFLTIGASLKQSFINASDGTPGVYTMVLLFTRYYF